MTITNSVFRVPIKWIQVTTNTNMTAFNGYIGITGGSLTFTLPSIVNIYDMFSVQSSGGFVILANSGQQIVLTGVATGTTLTSPSAYSTATLLCTQFDSGITTLAVNSLIGTMTVT